MNLLQIYEGWRNNIIPPKELQEAIRVASEERMNICNTCIYNSKNKEIHLRIRPDTYCTVCSCTLSAKTKCLSCQCPKDYWGVLLTQEQENDVEKET